MLPPWRKWFLVPVYGFVIALGLTLAAGSVVGAASDPAPLAAAEARATKAEAEAKTAVAAREESEKRANDLQAQVDEATKGGAQQGGTQQGGKPTVQPQLIIRAVQLGGKRLDPAVEKSVVVSYTVEGKPEVLGQLLDPDTGVFTVDRPQPVVTNACVTQPDGWQVDPALKPVPNPDSKRPRTVCLKNPMSATPLDKNFTIEFPMIPGGQ